MWLLGDGGLVYGLLLLLMLSLIQRDKLCGDAVVVTHKLKKNHEEFKMRKHRNRTKSRRGEIEVE